jgi:AcrR family transcriptional regulator
VNVEEPGAAPAKSRRRRGQQPQPDPFERLRQNQPQQARSRETLSRLLKAAEELLNEGGLEAATVPAIAERAGVSVGVIYRRFPDKDNLLRAVFERFFVRTRENNMATLQSLANVYIPLPVLVRKIVHGTVEGQRRTRHILRALIHFYRTHHDRSFKRAAIQMNREGVKAVATLLMAHASEFQHPNPEQAIEFALLSIGAVLYATVLEQEPLYTLSDPDAMEAELTRMIFMYLGIKE